ncbi:MOSC domain-containing protein [Thiomicrorhabdus aquaedulcis]|uniref:MOSC domain-containing protein n=1 Tax=Thiomicrorhabdus aquaedulcis TaxID=2211106 RepID=UPI000FDB5C24|nr:MOSC domain-containing protein [Thiomicrorhabdus aquaedulcis]
MAKLLGIATHAQSKSDIITHERILIGLTTGLTGDYRGQKDPKKQVTLLSKATWDAVTALIGEPLDWTQRRANLLIDDMDFSEALIGQQVQIGAVLLEITCETDPCSRMLALNPKLKDALTPDWRGGARCKVLREGEIKIGDPVHILKRL